MQEIKIKIQSILFWKRLTMVDEILKRKIINMGTVWNIPIDKFSWVVYQETACKISSGWMDWNISSVL